MLIPLHEAEHVYHAEFQEQRCLKMPAVHIQDTSTAKHIITSHAYLCVHASGTA